MFLHCSEQLAFAVVVRTKKVAYVGHKQHQKAYTCVQKRSGGNHRGTDGLS